jgi:hypothetical protein
MRMRRIASSQLAILHAEFEALHPFLDGNGRLGRMLVPLFMWQVGSIRRPMFYFTLGYPFNRSDPSRLLSTGDLPVGGRGSVGGHVCAVAPEAQLEAGAWR